MDVLTQGLFNSSDRLQMASLTLRDNRSQVISANIANSETPGFRAIGYDFEQQLQEISSSNKNLEVRASNEKHLKNAFTQADGSIRPDVYVRPSESVGQDGNTVDNDLEMAKLAENQIIYQTSIEILNRKFGMLRYAISGGR